MAKALYIAYLTGAVSQSIALFYIGDGVIAGVDVGTMRYDGTYIINADGSLEGTVGYVIPAGAALIAGVSPAAETTVPLKKIYLRFFGMVAPSPSKLPLERLMHDSKTQGFAMTECPEGFWCMQFKDWLNVSILVATIIAIIVGPIAAVLITRKHDTARERLRRRHDIFNRLMMTRRAALSAEHVTALNVIETEFNDDPKIIEAFKKYIDLLARPFPPLNSDPAIIRHFADERDDGFNELMAAVGQSLGFNFDKRDLAKYSYVPQGWINVEAEQTAIRQLSIEVLQGKRGLPVVPFRIGGASEKFPPAPT